MEKNMTFSPNYSRLKPKKQSEGMKVYLTPLAEAKMSLAIQICPTEIGWLSFGTEQVRNGELAFIIDDLILFHQRVSGTTTELDPVSIGETILAMMKDNQNSDFIENIRVWGHSHVCMGTGPSGQDESQMQVFASETPNRIMVRLIGNKYGDLRVDLFKGKGSALATNIGWDYDPQNPNPLLVDDVAPLLEQMSKEIGEKTHPLTWKPEARPPRPTPEIQKTETETKTKTWEFSKPSNTQQRYPGISTRKPWWKKLYEKFFG